MYESWCFAYDPKNVNTRVRLESVLDRPRQRIFASESRASKPCQWLFFFDSRGLIHKEFVPTGQTVNANFYEDILDHLIKRINRVRLDLHVSRDWFLQHDNASAHNAASVRQFLAKKCYSSTSLSLFVGFGSRRLFLIPEIKIKAF